MVQPRLNEENIEGKVSTIRFDEEGNRIATNHSGWNVEKLSLPLGWKAVFEEPCESRSDAVALMVWAKSLDTSGEYRVYEALE